MVPGTAVPAALAQHGHSPARRRAFLVIPVGQDEVHYVVHGRHPDVVKGHQASWCQHLIHVEEVHQCVIEEVAPVDEREIEPGALVREAGERLLGAPGDEADSVLEAGTAEIGKPDPLVVPGLVRIDCDVVPPSSRGVRAGDG
jgi:hypothetical protein